MIKSRATAGKVVVTFTLDAGVEARHAVICGDWNGWTADRDVMVRSKEGSFSLAVPLAAGQAYRFRYLLDGERWENDWEADAYVPNDYGGDDSLVDLTVPAGTAPAKKVPAKKAAAPAKKTAAKKVAVKKAAKKAPAK